jgi:hypothetical protein
MKTDFKVYPRKIHVYCKGAPKTAPHLSQFYAWSTNAYKTCRDAVVAAKALHPSQEFTARFAKD